MTRHDDPTIDAFLADGGYHNIDQWMEDSGYVQDDDGDYWRYPDDYADPTVAGTSVDPEGTIEGAIEASGFVVPESITLVVDNVKHDPPTTSL